MHAVDELIRPDPVTLTPEVEEILDRARCYLEAGFSLHLCGPAGVGKTTLALHLARLRQRPVVLVHGDASLSTAELVGAPSGFVRRTTVDQFIRTVRREESYVAEFWTPNRLTLACREGATLVYDEFNRASPEANNVLLPVLEEKLLPLPTFRGDGSRVALTLEPVHPAFRAILTSNPEEEAGVHAVQAALLERVITLRLDGYSLETQVEIVRARSGLAREQATVVVRAVEAVLDRRRQRSGSFRYQLDRRKQRAGASRSLRPACTIARVAARAGIPVDAGDAAFVRLVADVLQEPPGDVAAGISGLREREGR